MIWFVFILSQIADVWSTAYALDRGATEANPAVRWMMRRIGRGWPILKIAIASAGAWFVWRNAGDVGVLAVAAVFFVIAWHNWRLRK